MNVGMFDKNSLMLTSIIIFIMEQEVKLVVAQSLDGQQQDYFIFKNVKYGEGGFGVVKKALASNDKSKELAVKIVPYGGDPVKRKKIEKQINIIRVLPDHINLVKVHPIKCFSQNNFYIFMECCKDGTLADLLKEPGLLDQSKILDVFWQLMNGYRVLWENGILHQDLKLANVLVKNNVLKITDFGFSILTESYVPSLIRQGTLQYMSLEKLTDAAYVANQKTDVYSLGVMMHQIMTKIHPYVNQKAIKNHKEYVAALRNASLVRPKLISTFSVGLQGLYDLVVRMVAKSPKDRVECQQIYDYLDNDEIFTQYRSKNNQKTQEVMLNLPPMTITEQTSVFAIPFAIAPEGEHQYIEKIKVDKEIKRNQQNQKIIHRIEYWALSLRLIVYYLDRLARRLFIEKLRSKFYPQKAHSYNRIILACFLTQAKLTRWILKELRYPKTFTKEEIDLFRNSQQGIRTLKIVRRDEEYIRQQITDNLKRTTQVEIKQQNKLMRLAQKEEFSEFLQFSIPFFQDCIAKKATLINNKKDLVTLTYLIDSIELISKLPNTGEQLQLEEYFYSTETRNKVDLFLKVDSFLSKSNIESNFSDQIYQSDEANIQ